ncbi:MAG: hypothetical protein ACKO1H_11885 [Tabrizicola sp.]
MALVLSGCCAPDRCDTATSRFEKLDPVIAQVLLFEDREGRLPDTLEEAFPESLPKGIKSLEGRKGYYGFENEDGNFPTFSYGRFGPPGDPRVETTIQFSYVGGGLLGGMNVCFWTEAKRSWECFGYM